MIKNLQQYVRQPQFLSTGLVFAMHAFLFSLWVTRLPEVKETLQLSDADLGVCLFFMPFGAFIAMFTASTFIRKFGAGRVTMWFVVAYCLVMMLPLLALNAVLLSLSLFVVGLAAGTLDISMNAVAAALEKIHDRVIMATTHGFFSLGGMVGAFLGSALIGLGVLSWVGMLGGIVLCMALLFWVQHHIGHLVGEEEESGSHLALPGRAVIGLAIIGFFTMMGEGAVTDWSGIYLKDTTMAEGAMIGFGFAGFSLAMTIGRFYGDILIARLGASRIILLGSLFVIAGLGLVLLAESYSSILGFTLVGLGYSSIIPVVFSEAARSDEKSASRGITAVVSFGYIGFLSGPVLIGLISDFAGLKMGMMFLLSTSVLTLVLARFSFGKMG